MRCSMILLAAAVSALCGCPTTPMDEDAGDLGPDTPALDALQTTDAPAPDSDGDGIEDTRDCDPASPTVGATGTRPCTGSCGAGTESCTDGVWAPCVPAVECACTTEGMRRTTSCGRCGEQAQECTAGMWAPVSECLNQGECMVGDVEHQTNDYCLDRQRICGDSCEWGDWDYAHAEGICARGEAMCDALFGDYVCTDECERIDNPCCPLPVPVPSECM